MRTILGNYKDFIKNNKNCNGYKDDVGMQEIFNFLCEERNVIKMVEYSDVKKPALAAVVLELEKKFGNSKESGVDLKNEFTRTVIGRLIKYILADYGYIEPKQKDLPNEIKAQAKYFSSGSWYSKKGPSEMRIIKITQENLVLEALTMLHVVEKYWTDKITKIESNNDEYCCKCPFCHDLSDKLIFNEYYFKSNCIGEYDEKLDCVSFVAKFFRITDKEALEKVIKDFYL